MESPSSNRWHSIRSKEARSNRHRFIFRALRSPFSFPALLLGAILCATTGFSQFSPVTPAAQSQPPAGGGAIEPAKPAAGLRLVANYLPLEVGNRWTYQVELNGRKRSKPVIIEIKQMIIKNFRSYYLFNRFPFAPTPEIAIPLLRFDRLANQFDQLVNEQDAVLFPQDGPQQVTLAPAETASRQVDLRILKATFQPAPLPGIPVSGEPITDELVFKYDVGIISARMATQFGVEKYSLLKAEKNVFANAPTGAGPTPSGAEPAPALPKETSPYAAGGPRLELSVEPETGKVKFTLRVVNEHERMTPLNFNNDQSFDFLVLSEGSDRPVWRWGADHYFSQVKRSRGLLPQEALEFSAEWNGLDDDHHPLPAGKYRVVGVLTSTPDRRTPPLEFTFTPAPNP